MDVLLNSLLWQAEHDILDALRRFFSQAKRVDKYLSAGFAASRQEEKKEVNPSPEKHIERLLFQLMQSYGAYFRYLYQKNNDDTLREQAANLSQYQKFPDFQKRLQALVIQDIKVFCRQVYDLTQPVPHNNDAVRSLTCCDLTDQSSCQKWKQFPNLVIALFDKKVTKQMVQNLQTVFKARRVKTLGLVISPGLVQHKLDSLFQEISKCRLQELSIHFHYDARCQASSQLEHYEREALKTGFTNNQKILQTLSWCEKNSQYAQLVLCTQPLPQLRHFTLKLHAWKLEFGNIFKQWILQSSKLETLILHVENWHVTIRQAVVETCDEMVKKFEDGERSVLPHIKLDWDDEALKLHQDYAALKESIDALEKKRQDAASTSSYTVSSGKRK